MENFETVKKSERKELPANRVRQLVDKYTEFNMREEKEYLVFEDTGGNTTYIHKWHHIPRTFTDKETGKEGVRMVAMEDYLAEQLGF